MTTCKAISTIYEIAKDEVGQEDAKRVVSGIMLSVLTEIEDSGASVTEENLAKALEFVAHNFLKAARRLAA